MWDNPATTDNLEDAAPARVSRGRARTGQAGLGRLAAQGRMAEPEALLDAARWVLGRQGPLAGRSVVVTAGGTRGADRPGALHRQPQRGQDGLRAGRRRPATAGADVT